MNEEQQHKQKLFRITEQINHISNQLRDLNLQLQELTSDNEFEECTSEIETHTERVTQIKDRYGIIIKRNSVVKAITKGVSGKPWGIVEKIQIDDDYPKIFFRTNSGKLIWRAAVNVEVKQL